VVTLLLSMSYKTQKLKTMVRDHLPGVLGRWRAAMDHVPDARLYSPTFQPWRGMAPFRALYDEIASRSLVQAEAAWVLHSLARQASSLAGDFFEAGVYRGGTARLLRRVLETAGTRRPLHLFDTFAGLPERDPQHPTPHGEDFADTSLDSVSAFVGGEDWIHYHPGLIPDSFRGLEDTRFAFAHVDVDSLRAVQGCCEFVYPRLVPGGIMLFDDYGVASCPGARAAVDDFFAGRPEVPLVLHTGQAVVHRTAAIATVGAEPAALI
jgi:O-methyltransferase